MIGVDAQSTGPATNWRFEGLTGPRATDPLRAEAFQENRLLAALPAEVLTRLRPRLELVQLPLGKVLFESGAVQRHVYFPIDCVVALLCDVEDGSSGEVAVVGNEGVAGLASFVGAGRQGDTCRLLVQCGGLAYRLPSECLKAELERHGEVLRLILGYTLALIAQISQTAICGAHHQVDQRLCLCLLRCLDRLPTTELVMTQELMAGLLGVRRESVTGAAGKLQRLGVIKYSRGHITVLDRPRLESLSCECYSIVKEEGERLLPPARPQPPRTMVA